MLTRREEKLLRGLATRKLRQAEGAFLVEGVRAVEDLMASPLEVRLLVHSSSFEDTPRAGALLREAARRGVPVRVVEPGALARYADTQSPQGVLAVAVTPHHSIEALAPRDGTSVVLALDGVQDPGNFGTLARTAEALGAVGLLVLPGTVDPWNSKAVRAAMGASFRLPIVDGEWSAAGPWLHDHGYTILAAAADGEPLGEDRPDRAVLVVGNEGAGVTTQTRVFAERCVAVPLRGRAESLNVAAAAAILLHELLR